MILFSIMQDRRTCAVQGSDIKFCGVDLTGEGL